MKGLVNALIGLSVVVIIIAIISKFCAAPILGVGLRSMCSFAALLLLLAIALSVKK